MSAPMTVDGLRAAVAARLDDPEAHVTVAATARGVDAMAYGPGGFPELVDGELGDRVCQRVRALTASGKDFTAFTVTVSGGDTAEAMLYLLDLIDMSISARDGAAS